MWSWLLVVLAACSADPPSPATVRAHVDADLGNVLGQTQGALEGVTGLPVPATFALAGLGGVGLPSLDASATTAWLDANVFSDANATGDGAFALPASLFCADAECEARVADAQPRVRVEQEDGGAMRFAIELDGAHDEPLSFLLAHDSLAAELDLDGAAAATAAFAELAPIFSEPGPDAAPTAMTQGAASARIAVLGDAHVQVSASIDRAIMVAAAPGGTPLAGDGAVRFASDAAPVLAIELDGNAPKLTGQLALGETIAHVGSIDVDLAGATASGSWTPGALTLANVSLGGKTTTVERGGAPAMTLDLDPLDGRALAVTLASDGAGTATLAFTPRLDLERWVDHAVLGDAPPVYDVTSLVVDGALVAPAPQASVRVQTGALSAATSPASYGFDATAGECVTASMGTDASGASFTRYAVAACP
jgi:hypothetical protein